MNVLAIDPGDTTGIFASSGSHHVQMTEFHVIDYLERLHDDSPIEHVVMERFNLYDKRSKANAGWALNVIGAVTYWCWDAAVPLTLQWNRDKNQVSDKMLEDKGMLIKPKHKWRHANDAARHYVYWQTRNGR